MPHMKIPPFNKGTKNACLPFPYPNFIIKIVTIHNGKLVHNVRYGQFIQAFIWKLSLCQELFHYFCSFLEGVVAQDCVGIFYDFAGVFDVGVVHYFTMILYGCIISYDNSKKYNIIIQQAGMIRKLPQHVINEISAGQVIQRPYNVIKQLVENSIDAGSNQINVSIQQGGLKLIKIADNGKGIMLEDFPLLCARFATSKIKDFGDMAQLCSFGFRGEALASLSYVSNLTICSKWHQDAVGHSASFKNQQLQGSVGDIPMNTGTTITATDLFLKLESRRASLNPLQEKKKIFKLLSHFCLHYPQIRFTLITQKGDEGLPRPKSETNKNQAKMQVFQQLTKLSYDKFTYVSSAKIGLGVQVEAIMTKINCCKGKTLMLNINNRIVESIDLFKAVQKAYSQCYQSIHEENQSFWVYLSLEIDPKLIDCNVHPTKKAVGLFAGEEVYEQIKLLILNQIRKDSAIKVIKANTQNQKMPSIQESIRQKMGISLIKQHNSIEPQPTGETKSKIVYAFQKNRTDSKQLPITYFSRSQNQGPQKIQETEFFKYGFSCWQKNVEIKKLFSQCSYVGCYGLNYILVHYQNKLYMMNILPFLPSFIPSYCQSNRLHIKKVKTPINIPKQIRRFLAETKLLPNPQEVQQWIQRKQSQQIMRKQFGITIQETRLESYPCLGDIFVECLDQDQKIGWEVAYLVCRIYNAVKVGKINGQVEDKFMAEFIAGQFRQEGDSLSPFNQKISNFFQNRVVPVLKTNPLALGGQFDPNKFMKQMLDLKDIYKIFQRC